MGQYPLLDNIHAPTDLRSLPHSEFKNLAAELRRMIIETVSQNGGHLASSLGAVELTIALHYVFCGEQDELIFDVGHQAYAHKLLTGRREAFGGLRQQDGISGFPVRSESKYDSFGTGHASTSISAAVGMARAKKQKNDDGAVVALIGDGALTGGMAFEALNDAGQTQLPIIVVLNDNAMSISKNVGAMYQHLSKMRASTGYQNLKKRAQKALSIGVFGRWFGKKMESFKNRVKYFLLPNVMFEAFGFKYLGPIDGHDTEKIISVLEDAKLMHRPVIIHAITEKGKGYSFAENNPELFHGVPGFDIASGEVKKRAQKSNSEVFGETILALARKDERINVITAAMTAGLGLKAFAKELPDRFFDVAIAEQHALTMAAGMAAEGVRPVVAIYSTFLQRAYDQVLHDICLQNLPVVLAVDRAGLVGEDGATHQGIYDIAYLLATPGMRLYSPASIQELEQMISLALSREEPCAIRYGKTPLMNKPLRTAVEFGKWEIVEPIRKITVVATGAMVEIALHAARACGDVGLVNARFIEPMDDEVLDILAREAQDVITIEDGVANLGLGARITLRLNEHGVRVHRLGVPNQPITQASVAQQREQCGLTEEQIVYTICGLKQP